MPQNDGVERDGSPCITLLLNYSKGLFQGVCTCGWTSMIGFLEETDLLRAMHAHAVATFESYR